MTQVADKVLAWLYNVLQEYQNPQRTYKDAAQTLSTYPSLAPRTEVYTYENGTSELLLTLSGTLPVEFRGTIYHFPIKLWIPHTFPGNAPFVFVDPARDMLIRPGQHVGVDGKVYHAYLRDWNNMQDRASIIECLDFVQQIFAREPPVISRAHRQQYLQRSELFQGNAAGLEPAPPQVPPKPKKDSIDPVELPTSGGPLPPPKPPKEQQEQQQRLSSDRKNSSRAIPALTRFSREAPQPYQYIASSHPIQDATFTPVDWQVSTTHDNYQDAQATLGPNSNEWDRGPRLPHGYPTVVQSSRNLNARDHRPNALRYNQNATLQYSRAQSPVSPVSPIAKMNEHSYRQYSQAASSQFQAHPAHPKHSPGQSAGFSQTVPSLHIVGRYGDSTQRSVPNQHGPTHSYSADSSAQVAPDLLSDLSDMAGSNTVDPTPGTAPPIPPNPQKENLLHALSLSLVSLARTKVTQHLTNLAPLQIQEQALNGAHARLESEIRQLEHLSELLNSNESILHRTVQDCETTIKSAKSKPQPPIDEVLVAPTLVAQQLWTLCAEESACREAMYVLQKGLDQGRISGEVFMRQMRSLGRERFLKMALVRKCAAGLGLEVQGR